MGSDEPRFVSAVELASRIRRRAVSPVEVVDRCLETIERRNHRTNAFVTVLHEDARQRAKQAQRQLETGAPVGPLHGVPIAIKDAFNFKRGVRSTLGGSTPFRDFVAEHTSSYVRRLESAGAIVVGKTNAPEFGHKGTTDNALFGPTSTPVDRSRNAGGSSGGSAAAVADGLVPLAQGTDGGGSIRIPASFCGIVGLKPSYGRVADVSRPDAFASDAPFLHVGPLARTVEDAALMLEVLKGPHPRDPLSAPDEKPDLTGAPLRGLADVRVAYSPNLDVFPVEPEVGQIVEQGVEHLREAGATVRRVPLGIQRSHRELCEIWLRQTGILYWGALEGFKQWGIDLMENHREELTPEVLQLLEATRDLSVLEQKRDQRVRTEVFDALAETLETHDLIVSPTLSVPPVPNAEDGRTLGPTQVDGKPVNPLIGWCLTYPMNFTGHPAASVPAGFTGGGLPVGLQVIGRRFDDASVIGACAAIERINPWIDRYPDGTREHT